MKIVKCLEDSGLSWKGVSETIQNEVKEQKGRIFSMLLGILLGASLLGNILTGKGIIRAGYGSQDSQSKKGKGNIRAGYGSKRSSINDF